MIVFICPEPTSENERDGLIQRVKAIDAAFELQERMILSLSFTGNLRRAVFHRSPTLTVEYLNAFLHFPRIFRLARRASAVYVHTCHHAFRILPLYFISRNIITDLHGALVEEIQMQGRNAARWRYRHIERIVVRRSAALVYVSRALKTHMEKKYGRLRGSPWVIPIFSRLTVPPPGVVRCANLAIYAGGLQQWQCIDDMIAVAVKLQDRLRFLFLTSDPDILRQKAIAAGLNAEISSVASDELPGCYARAAMGFVLRDNSIVNAVACPTKLIEYLHSGIVPIVKLEQIGDFQQHGYQYIRMDDLLQGRIPAESDLDAARSTNRRVVEMMANEGREQLGRLVSCAVEGVFTSQQVVSDLGTIGD